MKKKQELPDQIAKQVEEYLQSICTNTVSVIAQNNRLEQNVPNCLLVDLRKLRKTTNFIREIKTRFESYITSTIELLRLIVYKVRIIDAENLEEFQQDRKIINDQLISFNKKIDELLDQSVIHQKVYFNFLHKRQHSKLTSAKNINKLDRAKEIFIHSIRALYNNFVTICTENSAQVISIYDFVLAEAYQFLDKVILQNFITHITISKLSEKLVAEIIFFDKIKDQSIFSANIPDWFQNSQIKNPEAKEFEVHRIIYNNKNQFISIEKIKTWLNLLDLDKKYNYFTPVEIVKELIRFEANVNPSPKDLLYIDDEDRKLFINIMYRANHNPIIANLLAFIKQGEIRLNIDLERAKKINDRLEIYFMPNLSEEKPLILYPKTFLDLALYSLILLEDPAIQNIQKQILAGRNRNGWLRKISDQWRFELKLDSNVELKNQINEVIRYIHNNSLLDKESYATDLHSSESFQFYEKNKNFIKSVNFLNVKFLYNETIEIISKLIKEKYPQRKFLKEIYYIFQKNHQEFSLEFKEHEHLITMTLKFLLSPAFEKNSTGQDSSNIKFALVANLSSYSFLKLLEQIIADKLSVVKETSVNHFLTTLAQHCRSRYTKSNKENYSNSTEIIDDEKNGIYRIYKLIFNESSAKEQLIDDELKYLVEFLQINGFIKQVQFIESCGNDEKKHVLLAVLLNKVDSKAAALPAIKRYIEDSIGGKVVMQLLKNHLIASLKPEVQYSEKYNLILWSILECFPCELLNKKSEKITKTINKHSPTQHLTNIKRDLSNGDFNEIPKHEIINNLATYILIANSRSSKSLQKRLFPTNFLINDTRDGVTHIDQYRDLFKDKFQSYIGSTISLLSKLIYINNAASEEFKQNKILIFEVLTRFNQLMDNKNLLTDLILDIGQVKSQRINLFELFEEIFIRRLTQLLDIFNRICKVRKIKGMDLTNFILAEKYYTWEKQIEKNYEGSITISQNKDNNQILVKLILFNECELAADLIKNVSSAKKILFEYEIAYLTEIFFKNGARDFEPQKFLAAWVLQPVEIKKRLKLTDATIPFEEYVYNSKKKQFQLVKNKGSEKKSESTQTILKKIDFFSSENLKKRIKGKKKFLDINLNESSKGITEVDRINFIQILNKHQNDHFIVKNFFNFANESEFKQHIIQIHGESVNIVDPYQCRFSIIDNDHAVVTLYSRAFIDLIIYTFFAMDTNTIRGNGKFVKIAQDSFLKGRKKEDLLADIMEGWNKNNSLEQNTDLAKQINKLIDYVKKTCETSDSSFEFKNIELTEDSKLSRDFLKLIDLVLNPDFRYYWSVEKLSEILGGDFKNRKFLNEIYFILCNSIVKSEIIENNDLILLVIKYIFSDKFKKIARYSDYSLISWNFIDKLGFILQGVLLREIDIRADNLKKDNPERFERFFLSLKNHCQNCYAQKLADYEMNKNCNGIMRIFEYYFGGDQAKQQLVDDGICHLKSFLQERQLDYHFNFFSGGTESEQHHILLAVLLNVNNKIDPAFPDIQNDIIRKLGGKVVVNLLKEHLITMLKVQDKDRTNWLNIDMFNLKLRAIAEQFLACNSKKNIIANSVKQKGRLNMVQGYTDPVTAKKNIFDSNSRNMYSAEILCNYLSSQNANRYFPSRHQLNFRLMLLLLSNHASKDGKYYNSMMLLLYAALETENQKFLGIYFYNSIQKNMIKKLGGLNHFNLLLHTLHNDLKAAYKDNFHAKLKISKKFLNGLLTEHTLKHALGILELKNDNSQHVPFCNIM